MKQYRIFHGRQDFTQVLDRMHQEENYSLAILDNGSAASLAKLLASYESLHCSVMVLGCWTREQVQSLSSIYSKAMFIAFDELPTPAQMINIASSCATSSYLLVMRSDMTLVKLDMPALVSIMTSDLRPLALCPMCYGSSGDLLPTVRIPRILGSAKVGSIAFMPERSLTRTLYPVYGAAFFNLALLAKLKGYDEEIFDACWRSYDLGSRAWLQGSPLYITDAFSVSFSQWRTSVENLVSLGTKERVIARTLGVWRVLGRNRINYLCRVKPRVFREAAKPILPLYKTDSRHLCESWPDPSSEMQ